MTSRVVLAAVPPGWGRTTALDRLAAAAGADDAPVTLIARIDGKDLQEEGQGVQAAAVIDRLAGAATRHPVAEFLSLDRLGGTAQLGLGVAGLFISGPAAAIGFLLAGVTMAGAGKAWDDTPAGQDGAVARAARAAAATSLRVPVVVIIDDADLLDPKLALTLIRNLTDRWGSQVLVVAAANPGGQLAATLTARGRQGLLEGLVHVADADPDMGYASRAALVRELRPQLPTAAVRRIVSRTATFADVFAVTGSPRLAEMNHDLPDAEVLAVVDGVVTARLRPGDPSPEAVVIAWAGGLLHARQADRAMSALGLPHQANPPADVSRRDHLERLANTATPQLTARAADLATPDRQAMARALLAEAAAITADPQCGPVERVAAARAAHRTRRDLPDPGALPLIQRRLAADLEELGDTPAALQIATETLEHWPPGAAPAERDWVAAAVLRLTRRTAAADLTPLAEALIAEASADHATLGEYHQALPHAQRELTLRTAIQNPDHPETLTTRANIAAWTGWCGDVAGALRLSRELLPDMERALGPHHPDTLNTWSHIAHWTGDAGDAAGALRLFRELLPDRERVLGPRHPETLTTRSHLAYWTGQSGDAAGALRLFRELLPDMEQALGPHHPDTLNTRNKIASMTATATGQDGQAP